MSDRLNPKLLQSVREPSSITGNGLGHVIRFKSDPVASAYVKTRALLNKQRRNMAEAQKQEKPVEAHYSYQKPKLTHTASIFQDEMRGLRGEHTAPGANGALGAEHAAHSARATHHARFHATVHPGTRAVWPEMPLYNPHMPDEDMSLLFPGLQRNVKHIDQASKPAYLTKRPTNPYCRETISNKEEETRSLEASCPQKSDQEWLERSKQGKKWDVILRKWVSGETIAEKCTRETEMQKINTLEAHNEQTPNPPDAANIFEDKMRGMRGHHTARSAGSGADGALGAEHAVHDLRAARHARLHATLHPRTRSNEDKEKDKYLNKMLTWKEIINIIPEDQLSLKQSDLDFIFAGMSAAAMAQNQRPQMNLPAAPPLSNQHTASSVPAQGAAAPHTGVGALVQWQPCASSHLPARGGLQPARLGGAPSSPRGAATPSAPRTHPVFMGQRPPAFKGLLLPSNGTEDHFQHACVPPINPMTPITDPDEDIPDYLKLPDHLAYLKNNLDDMSKLILILKFTLLCEKNSRSKTGISNL